MRREAKKIRALLIAEAANPEWVSTPLVGWSFARAVMEVTESHLVTQIRNRDALLRAGLVEGEDFTAIDSERVAGPIHRLGRRLGGGEGKGWSLQTALGVLSYRHFERLVRARFGERISRGAFDVVHRITPTSPVIPSALAAHCRRRGVPFVLGPLNGGLPWPPGFEAERRAEGETFSLLRSLHRLVPGHRSTRRHAAAILVGSLTTLNAMPPRVRGKCVYMPENAVPEAAIPETLPRRDPPPPLRAVFAGRLVPCKGVAMLLKAAAPLLRGGDLVLDLVGDGPERPRLTALLRDLDVESAVTMHGWVDHERVQTIMARAHVLAFPSIREFGGGVVLEAMAVGVVPLVVHHGGPAELVTEDTGVRVPLSGPEDLERGLRGALEDLCGEPERIARFSQAAVERVRALHTWPERAEMTLQVYRWVLGRRDDKPAFPELLPADLRATMTGQGSR